MTIDPESCRDPAPHRVPAWVGSLIFHVILLTFLGWTASRGQRGTGETADRPVGIAMVSRLPDRDQYTPPQSPAQPSETTDTSLAAAVNAAAAPTSPPIDLDGALAEMLSGDLPTMLTGDVQGTLQGTSGATGQAGIRAATDGNKTTAMVFGISGSGSRFVYVFDRSDSMNGFDGKPLRAAKAELKRSLQTLSERQQFQLIFYNDEPRAFVPAGSGLRLLVGEEPVIQRAIRYIDSIKAYGATKHYDALRMALRMGPDVIFFLTDARVPQLSRAQLSEVKRLAERAGTTIHTIEFGEESFAPAESFLRQLAADNVGQYRYIAVGQLGAGGWDSLDPQDVQATP